MPKECSQVAKSLIIIVPVQMQALQVSINSGTLEENQGISHTNMVRSTSNCNTFNSINVAQ